jgi:hypothetical protein
MAYDLDTEGNPSSFSHLDDHSTTKSWTTPVHALGQGSAPTVVEVPIHEGALFFHIYFEAVQPRYPFLDVEECRRAYQDWKTGEIYISGGDAWRSYLVKMACQAASSSSNREHYLTSDQIFAVGSLLRQARLDCSTRQQHHDLMLQAQADQTIVTDPLYKPVIRLQAMLLYAIHALHGESTPRLVHIVGVAMRFAVMKRFHCLEYDGTAETTMAIKAWWCIYS